MANLIPNIYQSAVYDFTSNGKGNAVIDAVAGSGKSTTIVNAIKLIPSTSQVLFLAFNKAIVEELIIKIGQVNNITVKTLHSLGAGAVMGTFRSKLDMNKYKSYVNNGIKYGTLKPENQLDESEINDYRSNINKLVDLYRVTLCNNILDIEKIAEKYEINILDNECEQVMKIVAWGLSETNIIDFTDMIYMPVVKKLRMPKYNFVLIDECQDLNACQRELFLSCLSIDGRFIAVGDPRQAIYGFAGADIESFNILKSLPNTVVLPLSVCYRCDIAIIELAKTIVPQIEARENCSNGLIDREAKVKDICDGDMILCRVTAPLVTLCMQYIAQGTKAYVKGKDIGLNLINMIKKTNRRNIDDVLKKLNAELYKLACKIVSKTNCTFAEAKENSTYSSMSDKIEAIELIANGIVTSDAVINRIDSIFKDNERTGICLSTIHKSKGLESNNVYIICEEKLLLKRAMKIAWTAEQEYNLMYVCFTRAKHKLSFVTDFVYGKQ